MLTSKQVLQGLGNVGLIFAKTLNHITTKSRIRELKQANIIEQKKDKYNTYRLTNKGKIIWNKLYDPNLENLIFNSFSANEEHDLRLSEFYFKQLSAKEQETWKTEKYIAKFYGTIGDNSLDGMFTRNNKMIVVECIGKSYSQKRINTKVQLFRKIKASELIFIKRK